MIDSAFFDRFHAYIPGWEIPKMRPEYFTNQYGLIVDFLAEWVREMRKRNFGDAISKFFKLGRDLNQRDTIAVKHTVAAFNQAFVFRRPEPGVVLHSDRGSQFASLVYRQRLLRCNCLQSMSRKGNCYDNAPMESFFKSYKSEEVTRQTYQTHEHATRGAVDYIDRFYNQNRPHSTLGYLSPNQFEAKFHSAPDKMLA